MATQSRKSAATVKPQAKSAKPHPKVRVVTVEKDGQVQTVGLYEYVFDEICQRIAKGETLTSICSEDRMPSKTSFGEWLLRNPEASVRFARARLEGADAIADETLHIVEEKPERDQNGKIDPGWVQLQKLRSEHRLKLLAKWFPQKYGDKVENTHVGADGGPVKLQNTVTFVKPPARPEDDE
jgi:hypothetical protein